MQSVLVFGLQRSYAFPVTTWINAQTINTYVKKHLPMVILILILITGGELQQLRKETEKYG